MAYIPDEAIYDSQNLSDSAFKIFCLICARRNHRSETAVATPTTIIRLLGLSKATYYRGIAELENKGWIERNGNIHRPLKGDYSPMNNRVNGSLKIETKSLKNETEKSHQRDSRNIYHDSFTSDKPYVLEASGPRIDQFHEENATNGKCGYCLGYGTIVMKDGSVKTCRCQPVLLEIGAT